MQNPILKPAFSRSLIIFLCCLLSLCLSSTALFAQSAKARTDSLNKARQQTQDSTRTALENQRNAQKQKIEATRAGQKTFLDSTRNARQHNLDSLKASRKKVTDSLVSIRKYRESKRYKDSVLRSRNQKIETVRNAQKARFDSLKAIRQHSTDSMIAIRKHTTDSAKFIQKKRTDSLLVIRKYRESKRFRDSVIVVRKVKMEELAKVRKTHNDSLFAYRKTIIDSSKAARKHIIDSTTTVRTKMLDSLKAVRKVKTDSLAKIKADKEKAQKAKEKQKESMANMNFELKLKKKRSVYTNNKMLKKKWSLPRQVVQNTYTRYNYYFNASRKMEEAKLNMQRIAKDEFNKPIALFSFDPNRDSTVLSADMDSVIQKASVGIQIHDPRTKWGDDLYLILGQAYFYKGDYNNAEASFRYIVSMRAKEKAAHEKKLAEKRGYSRSKKEQPSVVDEEKKSMLDFLKHESANNDALLWVARTYTQAKKYDEAASVLDLLSSDTKFPENMRGRLALELAFLNLSQGNMRDASAQLAIVSADKEQEYFIRRRAAFLAGQLYEQSGKYTEAADEYGKVIGLQPKIDMDFYARRNRAYNLMLAGGNQEDAIASLKTMLKDGKYAAYNEQIYYVLGRLSVNAGNAADAEVYLKKSISAPKTTKKQKASSFAALGNVYYNQGNWDAARLAYDSASRLASYAPDDTAVIVASRRSRVLDKVAAPARTISVQDSLLALSAMSAKEQRAIARKYIRSLEQARADSALRAENAANAPAVASAEPEPVSGSMSWYFSNAALTQQGFTEFKRKWGNRPLSDNWRRAATSSLAGSNTNNANSAPTYTGGTTTANTLDENGLPTEESLLAGIPVTQAQKDQASRQIQRAYVDLGSAYVTDLEDYPRAGTTFDKFDTRYTTSPFGDEALYYRYLIALRQNNLQQAKVYSDRLLQQYPSSKWADNVRPSGGSTDEGGLLTASTATVANYYDETYNLLMQRQYGEVLSRSRTGRQRYKDEAYGNRFRIMEAIAFAGSGNYKEADTLLNEFIRTHPTDSLRAWADNVMHYVQEQKKLDTVKAIIPPPPPVTGAVSNPVPVQQPTVSTNTAPAAPPPASNLPVASPAAYTYKPSEEHYFVFYVKNKDSKAMGVKVGMTDFNTMKFGSAGLSNAMVMLKGNEGMIVTKSFKNAAAAKSYQAEFKKTTLLTREFTADQYQTFIISASNYLKLTTDKDITPYLTFYRSKY